MSVKAMGLVWDLECPKKYGELFFKPSHKYVLIAYADHADHHGKNIFPAVPTIARKTGLDDRTVQRLTHDLEMIGLLIEDGTGPRGTNKWKMPFNDTGDKLTPVTKRHGDKVEDSLGDIPSGDIPSGDNPPPELMEPEPLYINIIWESILSLLESDMARGGFDKYIRDARPVSIDPDGWLNVAVKDESTLEWVQDRLTTTIDRLLIGLVPDRDVRVKFVIPIEEPV